tara:strand:- start:748 stop:1302 length:555 start_codon:yes stop_codon:yes gene_type:complete
MNIFYLSSDPKACAEDHCDKHVVKMIIEYAQLLSTAHRILDGKESKQVSKNGKVMVSYWTLPDYREDKIYRAAYYNHPSSIWVRKSKGHYLYLLNLWVHLCKEYTNRYDKVHTCYKKLIQYLYQLPNNIECLGFIPPPQCMPDEIKIAGTNDPEKNTIDAYRNFYKSHKKDFATWKTRIPDWYK